MKVVLHHPTLLPPKDYGGVERVVLWLAKGLQELGHEVWVAAYPGSRLPEGVQLLAVERELSAPEQLKGRLPKGTDLVHFMAPPSQEVMDDFDVPTVATVHGNGQVGQIFPKNSIFLSQNHAERHSASAFVYNGIDPAEYHFSPKKEDHFLFLSKTSWSVKNLSGAMRIARQAGIPLYIAGGKRPLLLRAQAAFNPAMRWVGPVAGNYKAEHLAQARGLLFPILWPEPFGLVVAEALMSGTPVVAYRKGSLPELVSPEVGALVSPETRYDDAIWASELQRVGRLSAEKCREWAIQKFHYKKMAEAYEAQYRKVSSGVSLHEQNPVASDWRTQ